MKYIKILLPVVIETLNQKEFLSESLIGSKKQISFQLNQYFFELIFKTVISLSLFFLIIYSLSEINRQIIGNFSKYEDPSELAVIYFSILFIISSTILYFMYQKTKDTSDKSLIKFSNDIELQLKSTLTVFLKGILEGIENEENLQISKSNLTNLGDIK